MAITLLRPAGKREKRNASGSELGTEAARREGMAEKRAKRTAEGGGSALPVSRGSKGAAGGIFTAAGREQGGVKALGGERAAYRARQRPRSDRGGAIEHGAAAHGCGNGKGLRAVALGAADTGGAAVYALRGREHGRTGGL